MQHVDRPHALRRSAFWPITGVVAVASLALMLICQSVAASQFSNAGVRPGTTAYTIAQLANSLAFSGAIFLGTFLGGQALGLMRALRMGERRALFLHALNSELSLIPHAAAVIGAGAHYRDPVRLTLLPRLLDGTVLDTDRDRDFLDALLVLQAAAGRYNDLVLTNAVILVNGDDVKLDDLARRYHLDVGRAVGDVRRFLPDR